MKPNELMIGDWVYDKHFNGDVEPIQIHNIYGTEVNCKTERNRFDIDEIVSGTYMSDLQPIPLTPEILEQNGFVKYNEVSDTPPYDKELCNCMVDDVKPIPLTLDILDKNGLVKLYTDYYDLDVYEENDGLWRIVYHNLECSGFDESVLVSSVHELQHFLKHVGIDKEIEL